MATDIKYDIYLVDDDHFLLDMYAVKFRNAGHNVTSFSNGEEVLVALRKDPAPTALLIDVVMPVMTGLEAVEAIRKENLATNTKIIMLTNQSMDADIDKAKSLKVDGYIIKASAIPSEVYAKTLEIIEKGKTV